MPAGSDKQRLPACLSIKRTTPKIAPFQLGSRDSHLIHGRGTLGPSDSVLKRHLDQFSGFRIAHERDQHAQTYRETDRLRYSVCSNRPLSLAITLRFDQVIIILHLYIAPKGLVVPG